MKIAVITGASAGIGRELVLAVDKAKDLDEIWVIARRRERLEELKTLCRTKILPIPLDLTRNTSIEEYRAFLIMEKPEIKLLINGAGFGVFGPFEERSINDQLDSLRLNVIALTAMCYASLPYMKKGS
ncbi:MAG: SDR family NAD(P)-dependent oxidoreductase, partial [Firmicutes bacterium]|nr:SDR family NAD(P)-dependent oxidoreductase [Bacillota bacterium]